MNKNKLFTILLTIFISLANCSSDKNLPPVKEKESEVEIIKKPAIKILNEEQKDTINFGNVVKNISLTRSLKIKNTGDAELLVTEVILPKNTYKTNFSATNILPDSIKEFTITFTPKDTVNYNGTLSIESNAVNGIQKIPVKGQGVSEIFKGNVLLKSDKEIESFITLGYTEITGVLFIGHHLSSSSPITTLKKLDKIKQVGSLEVASTIGLKNLSGIEGLKINHSIQIGQNLNLENIDALSHIKKVNGFLNIFSNKSLQNIQGLSNLTEVGDDLRIRNNDKLENINPLTNLSTVHDELVISDNKIIENLDGLSSLISVNKLNLNGNPKLFSYCGIVNLMKNGKIKDVFYSLSGNHYTPKRYQIESVCKRIVPEGHYQKGIGFSSNEEIEKFISKGYHIIEDYCIISGKNIEPNSLKLLASKVKIIKGTFEIDDTELTNLNGIENFESIGQIFVRDNKSLTDYCSLVTALKDNKIKSELDINKYYSKGNLYNPTIEDLRNGICKK